MYRLLAIIANKGYYYTPHIIKAISGSQIDSSFLKKRFCSIDKKYFEPIIDGMEKVLTGNEGTAVNSQIDSIVVCGKTGTAQNPHGEDHSIFIAFAPRKNPKIAIAVYVENGGWGATWAAPIATLMIEKYLKNKISNISQENFILNGILSSEK